ncbi:Uncharacterised protein [Mycobacterium tuberculosis]|nr:Uncharacterised protein [Mycobacterium tuberculosis]
MRILAHSASLTMTPFGVALTSLNSPIWRWNAVCGSSSRKLTPVFSITLFQRSTPFSQSSV